MGELSKPRADVDLSGFLGLGLLLFIYHGDRVTTEEDYNAFGIRIQGNR
jgi:hypothetical protein